MRRRLIRLAAAATGALLATAGTVTALSATPAGSAPAADTRQAEFQQVTLAQGVNEVGEPMHMAVLPDGSVLHTSRDGRLFVTDADGNTSVAGELDVYTHDEEGLQSVGVDPDFATNRYIYLYYSPELDTPPGDAPSQGSEEDFEAWRGYNQLSRFTLNEDNTLDLDSEVPILEVETDRGQCCHVGGDIDFDAEGNLYLSTGDDSNPFASDGYTPIDERDGRSPVYDARRSSGNTNDLRGKVLRIDVQEDGSYTIPEGNLFEPGTEGARPEIYLMGLRNPFRIEINRANDELYVGDYSPDASSYDPERGPDGQGRWIATQEAGNYGWPYCVSPDIAYVDYDFETGESRGEFDCANLVNDSPNNTGLTELPPVEQPDVWYGYDESEEFPELGTGGIAPMAGPVYEYDPRNSRGRHPVAWPEEYAGMPLFYEWTRHYIKAFHLDESRELTEITDVLPDMEFSGIIDMEFGPDGALYLLEYGEGYFAQNPEAQLARIDYVGPDGNYSPVPRASADVTSGQAPLTVQFSSEGTEDPEGDRLRYAWDFDSDGRIDSRDPNPTYTYEENGAYTANLRVTDVGGPQRGRAVSAEVQIVVGNEAPVVTFITPQDGDEFAFGDTIAFEVEVEDDQEVDCSRMTVTYILGHDSHGHPQTSATGCSGTIRTTDPEGHDPENDNLFGVFNATYTDPGDDDLPPLTGSAEVILTPTH